MACDPFELPPLRELPSPLTITPPSLPAIPEGDLKFCCKILTLPVAPELPPLLPGVLNAGVVDVLKQSIAAVTTYLDALPLDCPRE